MKRIFSLIALVCAPAVAGIWGPSSYDDCIIDAMKGVTSNIAANEIRKACRNKFPEKQSPIIIKELHGNAAKTVFTNAKLSKNYFDAGYIVEGYNAINHKLTSLTVQINFNSKSPITLRAESTVQPLSSGRFTIDINSADAADIASWQILSVTYQE